MGRSGSKNLRGNSRERVGHSEGVVGIPLTARRQQHARLSHDDGSTPHGTQESAQTNGKHLSPLRSYGEPLLEGANGRSISPDQLQGRRSSGNGALHIATQSKVASNTAGCMMSYCSTPPVATGSGIRFTRATMLHMSIANTAMWSQD